MALQSIPSRINDPLDSLVVTVGMMNGGTKENILADHVELVGTVRAFNREFRAGMPDRIKELVTNVAKGYGRSADCDYYFGPSPLINDDEELVELARKAAEKELGEGQLKHLPKMTGAEDFSVYMEHIPGVYGYLGFGTRRRESCATTIIRRSTLTNRCFATVPAFMHSLRWIIWRRRPEVRFN